MTSSSELDLIWEVKEIAKTIGRTTRQTFRLLETGQIPGRKCGGRWVVSRSELERFFQEAA